MTEEERAELKEIIHEVLRRPHITLGSLATERGRKTLADALVEKLVETQHFYYLPIKLRSEHGYPQHVRDALPVTDAAVDHHTPTRDLDA